MYSFFKKNISGPITLFLFQHKNKTYYVNYAQQHCYAFPYKPQTHSGFEPGSSVPETDAKPMYCATPPRRHAATPPRLHGV
jgi:hypothetical protein